MQLIEEKVRLTAGKFRVFLVDDTPLGLRLMERCLGFTDECNFEVVGRASDGVELTRKVRNSFPGIRVLVTSAAHQEEAADRALQAGAHEYCAKASLIAALTKE